MTSRVSVEHCCEYETSLSRLSEHDWNILRNRWALGIDWIVEKIGRRWRIGGDLGNGFPLFRTKSRAYEAASSLILAEASHRARHRA